MVLAAGSVDLGLRAAGGDGGLVALAAAGAAQRATATYPVPRDCTPVAVTAIPAGGVTNSCVHDLLVTSTRATAEQNSSTFIAVDGSGRSLTATIPNWWPNGGPVAGMVITLWGRNSGGLFRVAYWVEHNHGTGPSPAGPYPRRRLLDISAGKYPALQMAWVIATTFALDPQNPPSGDGDIHVQTTLPCPAAGLTFETSRTMRGYVDHPGFNPATESTNQADAASLHTTEAPPIGVPVMMLGQLRVDFGFGWWEVHPVRAWRFLTTSEAGTLAAECANAPVPVVDRSGPDGLPLPYGAPPCTDGSEFRNPGSLFQPCSPHCYVATTAIGQPDTYAGHCAGVTGVGTVATPSPRAPAGSASPAAPATSAGTQLPPTAAARPVPRVALIGVALFGATILAAMLIGIGVSRRRFPAPRK